MRKCLWLDNYLLFEISFSRGFIPVPNITSGLEDNCRIDNLSDDLQGRHGKFEPGEVPYFKYLKCF